MSADVVLRALWLLIAADSLTVLLRGRGLWPRLPSPFTEEQQVAFTIVAGVMLIAAMLRLDDVGRGPATLILLSWYGGTILCLPREARS